jgi:hypothetical protein
MRTVNRFNIEVDSLAMVTHQSKTCKELVCRVLLVWPAVFAYGCYDGGALVKQAQSTALKASLAEVDLGEYRTTLPRDPESGVFTTLDVHIFGTVPRSRLSEVKKQLKADEFRIRHEALTAVRQSSRDELTDPTLAKLRERIEEVVNRVLADAPINGIGFYQLTLR